MLVTTSGAIAGRTITTHLGLAKGNTIRARHIGRDIIALLRLLVGGEIQEYTKLMAEAREQALDRMISDASAMGANAIIDVRFSTSSSSAEPPSCSPMARRSYSTKRLSRLSNIKHEYVFNLHCTAILWTSSRAGSLSHRECTAHSARTHEYDETVFSYAGPILRPEIDRLLRAFIARVKSIIAHRKHAAGWRTVRYGTNGSQDLAIARVSGQAAPLPISYPSAPMSD